MFSHFLIFFMAFSWATQLKKGHLLICSLCGFPQWWKLHEGTDSVLCWGHCLDQSRKVLGTCLFNGWIRMTRWRIGNQPSSILLALKGHLKWYSDSVMSPFDQLDGFPEPTKVSTNGSLAYFHTLLPYLIVTTVTFKYFLRQWDFFFLNKIVHETLIKNKKNRIQGENRPVANLIGLPLDLGTPPESPDNQRREVEVAVFCPHLFSISQTLETFMILPWGFGAWNDLWRSILSIHRGSSQRLLSPWSLPVSFWLHTISFSFTFPI